MSTQIVAGAALVAGAVPIAWWAVASATTSARSAASALTRGTGPVDFRTVLLEQSAHDRLTPVVISLAAHARRITPVGMVEKLEERLAASGIQAKWTIERVLAGKLALVIAAALMALLRLAGSINPFNITFSVLLLALGWKSPDILIGGRADARRKKVQHELPDVMDQVTIAVEAGLGFESAMARVASGGGGVLSGELARTLQDIQLGVPRAEALDGLAKRCDLADLRHFVTAVRQAERYGLPIANVLRVQSTELREKRRQRAEEHAMKIPVKVLFPLIFCILPTLFIVVIGPGVLQIIEGFSNR